MSIRRRTFIKAAGASGLALGLGGFSAAARSRVEGVQARLRDIETRFGGTLGAEILDLGSGAAVGHNRDERFGHASSFKLSLAALLLARHAAGEIDADRHVRWDESDMMRPDTFTRPHLETGASLRDLARATQTTSDNPAANILLRELGGPAALTAFWRSIGDEVSRLDRNEPSVNLVPPGEIRDTTTPAAMARTVAQLVYGTALPQAERAMLKQWMVDTGTGRRRVRAGLPDGWLAGDKTGTGLTPQTGGTYIDIGFVEPPETSPLVFAAYYRPAGTDSSFDRAHEAPLKQVGEVLADFARMQG
ncbi:MAG: class A beta-lactamase [Erythrobacter sp.]|nr:class A beta-lactamase [Erythrobacter sp.]